MKDNKANLLLFSFLIILIIITGLSNFDKNVKISILQSDLESTKQELSITKEKLDMSQKTLKDVQNTLTQVNCQLP